MYIIKKSIHQASSVSSLCGFFPSTSMRDLLYFRNGPSASSSHHLISPFLSKLTLSSEGAAPIAFTALLWHLLFLLSQLQFPQRFLVVSWALSHCSFLQSWLPPPLVSVLLRSIMVHMAIPQRPTLALLFFSPCACSLDLWSPASNSHTCECPLNLYLRTFVSDCLIDIYSYASPNISNSRPKSRLLFLSMLWPSPLLF